STLRSARDKNCRQRVPERAVTVWRRRRRRVTVNASQANKRGGRYAPAPKSATFDQECPVPAETHVEQGPLDRAAVFEPIRDRLADILEIDPSGIKEGESFVDDLDADSLALIELVEALEEELGERSVGFHIDDEDLADLKTVRDAVDYVAGRLNPS